MRQQQGLIPRQPVGIGADLTLAIEEQATGLLAALGGQVEADQAGRAGRSKGSGGHGGRADRTRPPRPVASGHPVERLLLSPPAATPCPELTTSRRSLRDMATAAVVTGARPRERALGLTLIEVQKARRAEQLAVLKTFAEGELLRHLSFRNLVGVSLSFPAETKLPRVGFRAVNEGYRQSYGVINSDSEFVHLFVGDLDVDRSIVDLQGPEARAAQTEMKVRSMRLTLEAAIINGDDTFDPRAFNGLSKRLVPSEVQTIDNGGTAAADLAALELGDALL